MEKYDYISELAENTAFEIVQNQEEWKKYLTTAARLYKYPFREQLLIYAQRPDATACASIEIWNERMHCWVKKGAKGIALLDDADRGKKLKYVFDVADVYAAKQTGRYPQTWKLYPEHEASVLNHLEQIYGATDPQNSFENCASHSRYFSDELDAQNFYQNGNKCLSYSYAYGILFL